MVAAFGADLQICLKVLVKEGFFAFKALDPEISGNIKPFGRIGGAFFLVKPL